jgi:RNA polymerase-binding transcription factor DksA
MQLRDAALGRVESYEKEVDEIYHALRRIEDGTFGICELTNQRIERDRFGAEPWTRYDAAGQCELEKRAISARAFDEGGRPYAARRESQNVEEDIKRAGEVEDDESNG